MSNPGVGLPPATLCCVLSVASAVVCCFQWLHCTTSIELSATACLLACLLACRWMAMWLAAIGGEIIKVDHSFKAPKRIRDSAGQQQYAAVLTLMNEFCQVTRAKSDLCGWGVKGSAGL